MSREINCKAVLKDNAISCSASLGQTVIVTEGPETYTGPVTVTPTETEQTLLTKDKLLTDNVTVNPIPSEYVDAKADYDNALTAFGVESDLADGISALTEYSNEITGEQDETLSDAVRTLVDGYGQGGIEGVTDITIESAISRNTELDAVFSPYVDSGENCIFVKRDSLTGTGDMIALPYINGTIGDAVFRYYNNRLATVPTGSGNYSLVVSPGNRFIKVTLTGGST